jgi:hypothetical protein
MCRRDRRKITITAETTPGAVVGRHDAAASTFTKRGEMQPNSASRISGGGTGGPCGSGRACLSGMGGPGPVLPSCPGDWLSGCRGEVGTEGCAAAFEGVNIDRAPGASDDAVDGG